MLIKAEVRKNYDGLIQNLRRLQNNLNVKILKKLPEINDTSLFFF